MEQTPRPSKSSIHPVLIGCGAVLLLVALAVGGLFVWLAILPEGGVKMANEMDDYAWSYLEKHRVLDPDEQLLAYYDATMSMDGTEAAILTSKRVMYHKNGRTTAMALEDVEDISHRYESLIGDVIEITDRSGARLKIEIAVFNQGESFYQALMDSWKRVRANRES